MKHIHMLSLKPLNKPKAERVLSVLLEKFKVQRGEGAEEHPRATTDEEGRL